MAKALALLTVTALLVAAATAYAATGVAWHTGTNKTVKIRKGGTVKWTWADGQPHDVEIGGPQRPRVTAVTRGRVGVD